jgi:general secretion pathway protein H
MLILAPGISIPSNPKPMDTQRGFTILEILVVVAVISIITSTILLNTNLSRPDEALKQHTLRVSKTLKLLMQEAILNDVNYALALVPGGYLVLEFSGEEFLPSEDKFLKKLANHYSYTDELIIDNQIIKVEKKDKPDPHILILSSGEMTPFEWHISDPDNEINTVIKANMLGEISSEGPAVSLQ